MTHLLAPLREETGKVAASSLPRSCVYAIFPGLLSFPEVRFLPDIRRGFWKESLAARQDGSPTLLLIP